LATFSGVLQFPLIRQPGRQFIDSRLRKVRQQLREVELRVQLVAPAGTWQTGEDRCHPAVRGLPTNSESFRLSSKRFISRSPDVIVDRHYTIRAEDLQLRPLDPAIVEEISAR
jgi:hypothetical protein